jgi:hypothetical protein
VVYEQGNVHIYVVLVFILKDYYAFVIKNQNPNPNSTFREEEEHIFVENIWT